MRSMVSLWLFSINMCHAALQPLDQAGLYNPDVYQTLLDRTSGNQLNPWVDGNEISRTNKMENDSRKKYLPFDPDATCAFHYGQESNELTEDAPSQKNEAELIHSENFPVFLDHPETSGGKRKKRRRYKDTTFFNISLTSGGAGVLLFKLIAILSVLGLGMLLF